MVDLAKIRKKAKDRKTAAAAEAPAESAQAPQSAATDAPAPGPSPEPPAAAAASAAVPAASAQAAAAAAGPAAVSKLERFKSTAGQALARIDAAAALETQSEQQVELLTFVLGREQYAVPIEHIVEIIPPRPATRVPNADPVVKGIISLRGTIVTLLDVRSRLGHAAAAETVDSRLIVVAAEGETAGFVVDRVMRVVKTSPSAIEPPPMVHSSEQSEYIRGVFHQGKVMSILLDLEKLISS